MSGYAVSLSAGELVNRLVKALSRLIGNDELTGPLAAVLLYASKKSRVSYSEVKKVGDNLKELLLVGKRE